MKHFGIYRKLILIAGTATAAVSVGAFFFMEDSFSRMLFVVSGFVLLCGLLFLLDFLHNRYNDTLLEDITLLIEALVDVYKRQCRRSALLVVVWLQLSCRMVRLLRFVVR